MALPVARQQSYNITILGAMNPRIHHPFWYKLIGAITEEEYKQALSDPQLICTAFASQFSVSNIAVACQGERYTISTQIAGNRKRIAEIAGIVFKKLFETPINRVGCNSILELETTVKNVGAWISAKMDVARFGFSAESLKSGQLSLTSALQNHTQTITLGPSALAQDVVSLAINTEYKPTAKAGEVYVDFSPDLTVWLEANVGRAMDLAATLVSTMNSAEGQ